MEQVLTVKGLVKRYPSFLLDSVSFSPEPGKITGFIGRNGAGKTTTLHAILGFLHPDAGEVRFWGDTLAEREREIKRRIGFVSAGMEFYKKVPLSRITDTVRMFYDNWDEAEYRKRLGLFELDERKNNYLCSILYK